MPALTRLFAPQNAGFTLIELLLVIMIVGVVMTFVSLNIGAKPSGAKQAAHQLQSLLSLAQEEAILKGQVLGWKMTTQDYGFYGYKNRQWFPLTKDKLLRHYKVSAELTYKLSLENSKIIQLSNSAVPQLVILPDGSINDFTLRLETLDHLESYQVFSQQGKIKSQLIVPK